MICADAVTSLRRIVEESPRSLEELFTSAEFFGVVKATAVQRAICRVVDGRPIGELAADPVVSRALGSVSDLGGRPREAYVVSGVRVGKTLLSAAIAYRAVQSVDLSGLGPGDEPRIPILSLDRDKANACYLHLTETIKRRPAMARTVVREGRNELDAPAIWLRSPSGRAVQVCVAAGKAAGNAVVSY